MSVPKVDLSDMCNDAVAAMCHCEYAPGTLVHELGRRIEDLSEQSDEVVRENEFHKGILVVAMRYAGVTCELELLAKLKALQDDLR